MLNPGRGSLAILKEVSQAPDAAIGAISMEPAGGPVLSVK